jgi:type IV pilus assembly protein PilC
MATQKSGSSAKTAAADAVFRWKGVDRKGQPMQGELRATSEVAAREALRKQGIRPSAVSKQFFSMAQGIKPKEVALFTRQLSTMMKSGIPLLQSFEIVGQGSSNPSMGRMVNAIRSDVETGSSLTTAFRKHPRQFDDLYCNLVAAGESAGILDTLLDRLALYMEKTEAIKGKIKSALTYPIAVLGVAGIVVTVIMLFVVPAFKDMFASFGSELPRPTLILIATSEFFVNYWYLIFGGLIGGFIFSARAIRASTKLQAQRDRLLLRMPVFGGLIRKSCIARWTRTLATMFAAGVPLVEALESVGGASGNIVYLEATARIRQQVSSGVSLTAAMTQSNLFPPMVLHMCAIGEESGSIDYMLGKSADFFEAEVDEAVAGISSLMEPFIIVFLGTIIGGMVVALYLPIFKMGQVV